MAYSVVLRAMRDLLSQGWVKGVHGVGVFVAEQLPDGRESS